MKTENRNFYLGSIFLTFGVMFLTVIPMLVEILDLNIIIDREEIFSSALSTFIIGGVLYMTSISHYKRQMVWLLFLIAFFVCFQFAFLYFRHVIY